MHGFQIHRNFDRWARTRALKRSKKMTTTTLIEITYSQQEIKVTEYIKKEHIRRLQSEPSKYAPKKCIASKNEARHCSAIKWKMILGCFAFFFLLLWSPFCLFISGHSFVSRFCSVYVLGARSAQRCAEWTPLDSFFSLSKCALCASVAEFGFQNVYAYVSSMVSEWLWLLFFFFC